jgi:EmrB/QacA subfamily drug resistance transporter
MAAVSGPSISPPPSGPAVPAADPRRWLALGVIAVAQLMVVLDASIVTIALPSAQHALSISVADRQWVLTAYTLSFGGLLLLGGRIADYAGRKMIFIIGLIGFAGASALGGAAIDAGMLLGARALQGAFAALLAPAALSLISVTFVEVKERATAFAVYGAISGGGVAIGLIAGGLLTEYSSWRWCLLVNAPLAAAAALAAVPVLRESKAAVHTSYDVSGAVTVTAGLAALVYGFAKAASGGWASVGTEAFLGAAVALLTAFVIIEMRAKHPLLPMRVILERNRGGSFLGSLMASASLLGMFLFLTYYFQGTLGYSPLKSGLAFLPFSAGILVAAAASGRLLPRAAPRLLATAGLGGAVLGMLWLSRVTPRSSYAVRVLPAEILLSLGMGLALVVLSSTALYRVPARDSGVASALVNATQQVGNSLGIALLNTVAASATAAYAASRGPGRAAAAAAQVHGYAVGFLAGAGFLTAALLSALFLITATRADLADADGVSGEAVV